MHLYNEIISLLQYSLHLNTLSHKCWHDQIHISLPPHQENHITLLYERSNLPHQKRLPRFFKRLAEGVFDEEDLIFRTKELYDFLDEEAGKYDFDRANIYAIGYSNGANIAASLLFHYKDALKGAMLHHP